MTKLYLEKYYVRNYCQTYSPIENKYVANHGNSRGDFKFSYPEICAITRLFGYSLITKPKLYKNRISRADNHGHISVVGSVDLLVAFSWWSLECLLEWLDEEELLLALLLRDLFSTSSLASELSVLPSLGATWRENENKSSK